MQHRYKSLLIILIITGVIIILIKSGYISYDEYNHRQIETFLEINQKYTAHFGYIQPRVVDGFSERPIEGAVVIIPEIDKKFITNPEGLTPLIQVPINIDSHFQNILPKTWGEITILVFKEGYTDYALFHVHVWENQSRIGPKILLFPAADKEESDPMVIIESPHRLWVKQLIKKYKNQQNIKPVEQP
ncbi:MAG: hypothetical protein GX024_01020 [Clostridiales bacterium]|nr:hypothetical protein [Clostridiales bacterium]